MKKFVNNQKWGFFFLFSIIFLSKIYKNVTDEDLDEAAPVNSSKWYNPIYDKVQIEAGPSYPYLQMTGVQYFQLKRVKLSDDEHLYVIEYINSLEGVAFISEPLDSPEIEEDKFMIRADYLLVDVPFIMQTFIIDPEDGIYEEFLEKLPSDFSNNEVATNYFQFNDALEKIRLINQIKDQTNNTHQFTSFAFSAPEIGKEGIFLSTDNQTFMEKLQKSDQTFVLNHFKYLDVINLLKDLDVDIFTLVKAKILSQYDKFSGKYSDMERLLNQKPFAFILDDDMTLSSSLVDLYKNNWDHVFENDLITRRLSEINTFLQTSLNSSLIMSSSIFYINRYLFQIKRVVNDPSAIVAQLKDESDEEQKSLFINVLFGLFENLFSLFKADLEIKGFVQKYQTLFSEYEEQMTEYLNEIQFEGNADLIVEIIESYQEKFDFNFDVEYYLKQHIKPFVLKFVDLVEQETPELLLKDNVVELINKYFALYKDGEQSDESLVYTPTDGSFINFLARRRLLLT